MRETLDGAKGIKMENDQQLVVAGYADDVIIMAESEEDLKRITSKLIENGEKFELMVNEGKPKYMIVTRHNHELRHLKVNNYNFKRLANFKYLGVNINENADSHKEIRLRLVTASKCYFGLVPLLKSKLLLWKTKITLY
jgi:protein gp37